MFSPYYAWARRSGPADPENHCALNVALYGARARRWAMTERGRGAIARDAESFRIGPSRLAWNGRELAIEINEVAVPWPLPLRGNVRVVPTALNEVAFTLDSNGRHRWQPIAPCCRVSVDFDHPNLHWRGNGYFDINHGDAPLERDFRSWQWSRAATRTGTVISYDTIAREGADKTIALHVDSEARLDRIAPLAAAPLPRTMWRIDRSARADADAPVRVVSTLEDAPFYARSHLAASMRGEDVAVMHESLSLDRFQMPIVQAMLPFRMPRRRGPA
ncbi:carotenoid 1,2-hydratase [Bradyrhizobium sp. SSBR45G]|uniref:hydratase n=1 Tax=unclassified Bradyrhizobium TaxID=2631580 RepID=UPI0023428C6C|nr:MULTISPECIES: hydratase [unclassified Bradyrhizobium]GLH81757.1 carotenoid 1,2-hydratase [Bradyrhizobium sp. SSBR45G]GLH89123.1 carotenoid 1,2-hydratase [Bradyrhizobium sp. SSBR45R]